MVAFFFLEGNMENEERRKKLIEALGKPVTNDRSVESFDPWHDIIEGILGSYSSSMDLIFINALKAIRDRTTFDFIKDNYAHEMALYVLAGQGYTDYGTSPRGGWPDSWCADLWDGMIAKWEEYYKVTWEMDIA